MTDVHMSSSGVPHDGGMTLDARRLISLFGSLGAVVWKYDWTTRAFTYVSEAAEQLLGYPRDAWLQPGFWAERLHHEDAVWAPDFCRRQTEVREGHDIEYRMMHRDGSVVWVREVVTIDEHSDAMSSSGVLLDITSQKAAQALVAENERRFQEMVTNVGLLAVQMDAAGTIVFANKPVSALFGRDVVGHSLFEMVPTQDRADVLAAFDDRMQGGGSGAPYEMRVPAADGSQRTIRWISANLSGPHGEFAGAVSIGEDVTERAAFERQIHRKAEEFDAIFSLTKDLYFRLDAGGIIVGYAASTRDALYVPPEAFLGHEMSGFLPPDVAEVLRDRAERAHAHGEMTLGEYTLPTGDGTVREWEARFLPLENAETAVIIRDVTERNASQSALRESEERYRTLVELSPYAIYVISLDDVVLFCNDAAATLLGADSVESLTGTRISHLQPPDYVAAAQADEERVTRAIAGAAPGDPIPVSEAMQCTTLRLDGTPVAIERTIAGIHFKDRPALLVLARDITADLQSRRAIQEGRDFSERLLEMLDSGVIVVDGATSTIKRANRPAERLFGLAPGAMVGLSTAELHPTLESAAAFNEAFAHATSEGEPFSTEVRLARAGGQLFDAEVSVRAFDGAVADRIGIIRDISHRTVSERQLRDSEARFRAIIEQAPFGMHFYRLAGDDLYFTGANPAADEILNLDNSQFIGKTIEEAFPGLAATPVPEAYRKVAREGGTWQTEEIVYDEGEIQGAFEVCAFRIEPGSTAVTFRNVTERKRLEHEERRYAEKLSAVVAGLVNEQDVRQGQVAHILDADLSDTLARALSHLSAVGEIEDKRAAEDLAVGRELLTEALRQTRRLTAELAGTAAHGAGLAAALTRLCEESERDVGIPCTFELRHDAPALSEPARAAIFRGARELVRNVVEHANATRITVILDADDAGAELVVEDDGDGFDAQSVLSEDDSGFGLFAERDQMRRLGGDLTVESEIGRGTRVTLRAPWST